MSKEDYEFDAFISYQRLEQWPEWVNETFLPILRTWLSTQLGRQCRLFIDSSISEGNSWPTTLGKSLARSRILIPLFTRSYFQSPWCVKEFTLMLKREEVTGICGQPGLINPALLHDGEHLPEKAREIQLCDLKKFANPRMAPRGQMEEDLSEAVKAWVPSIELAIDSAPKYDPAFAEYAVGEMMKQFKLRREPSKTVPRL